MEKNLYIKIKILKDENIIKKKIPGIIFARAICSLGIVIYHFFSHSRGDFKLLQNTANTSFGFIFVTTFFCISGYVLKKNYSRILSFKAFYFKRWKSIFPSYYTCFFYFYLQNVFYRRKLLYNGHWTKFLLTLVGIDGYLYYRIKSYYIVGEWFLGALIIIYILYPLLLWIIKEQNIFFYCFIFFYYAFIYKKKFFIISNQRNLITCIISFYFGMNSIKYREFFFENTKTLILLLLILLILSTVKISSFILIQQIQGFSFFVILVKIGQYLLKEKNNKVILKISNLSYSIYLFHHRIIFDIFKINNPIEWYMKIIFLSITLLLTLIFAEIHINIVNSIICSKLFKNFESIFI